MRLLLPLLLTAACGGGSATPDARIDTPPDVPPDADTSVSGTWVDTYYIASGTMPMPACFSAPVAVVVDPGTGNVSTYPGSCRADGSFKIATPPGVTDYFLRAAGGLYETTAHSGLDLGSDQLGRSDATSTFG